MPPIVAGIIAAGGAIGGSLISRGGTNNIAKTQQSIADKQLALTQPAYQKAFDYYSNLLSGDPTKLMQATGPAINASNLQFNAAKQNLIGSAFGRGGGLTAGLSNIEGGRALSNSQIFGQAQASAPLALAALAQGGTSNALAALAGAQQSSIGNNVLQAQAMTGIGSFLTRMLSGLQPSSGSNYFGVNMNDYSGGKIPAAIIPSTGKMFDGGSDSYFPPNF
jgi:hypothetical protein